MKKYLRQAYLGPDGRLDRAEALAFVCTFFFVATCVLVCLAWLSIIEDKVLTTAPLFLGIFSGFVLGKELVGSQKAKAHEQK